MMGMQKSAIRILGNAAIVVVVLFFTGFRPCLPAADSPEESPALTGKLVFTIGSYLTDFNTDASIGSGGIFGTFFSVEDDLGIDDDQTLGRLDGIYRFKPRHSLGFGFWTLDREGTADLAEQLEFNGTIYDVGAIVDSEMNTSWLRLDWRYSMLRTDKGEAGVNLGLSFYDFEFAVEGLVSFDGGITSELIREEDDLIAPVPTVGMFLKYALKPKLIIDVSANFLDLDYEDFEGKLIETTFLVEWYFTPHFGIGGGFYGNDIEVKDTGSDPFSVEYDQTGMIGYLTFSIGTVD